MKVNFEEAAKNDFKDQTMGEISENMIDQSQNNIIPQMGM